MTIKFYLDKPKSTESTALYLFLRFGKTTLKFNTGKKIEPRLWNPENPNGHFRKFTGSPELNKWLMDLRSDVNSSFLTQKEWTLEDLKTAVNGIINRNIPKDSKRTFKEALDEFIKSRETNKELANNTIKKYKTLQVHLEGFAIKTNTSLRFEIVNKKLFEDFSAYLRNELKHTTNTVNKYLKTVKTFVHWAVEHEYVKADSVSTKYKITDDATEVVFLTLEELMRIYNLDLPLGSALDNVRDVFCFGCFTGQRFSDIANLKREDIVNDTWILHQIKVKDTIKNVVPLTDHAIAIINKHKHNAKPLPVISNQKTNEHLKVIGKKADIDEIVKTVRYRGNEAIVNREAKYKLLGTHTARRTFVTLSLEAGMRPDLLMDITGHKDFKTLKKYTAITDTMKSKEMKLIWNQQQASLKKAN
jgi:integrase